MVQTPSIRDKEEPVSVKIAPKTHFGPGNVLNRGLRHTNPIELPMPSQGILRSPNDTFYHRSSVVTLKSTSARVL